ncbi:MAG: hypothetical protein L0196_03325 [candidate division Zixibacteria bacterium]|nr:hypothetical protein [candidate division Zixibacteria bacterium]
MADEFHVTFTPGMRTNIGETLTITFDSPPEADPVKVALSEVDAWVSDGKKVSEGKGKPVLIGEFEGKITGGKFSGTLKKSSSGSGPALKVRFDGEPAGSPHSLPIPDSTLANEDGIFEVQVKVTGSIGKKAKGYTANSPVFFRNFKEKRPVVAFVTGKDKGGFFAAANRFWKEYADGKFDRGSVWEIREFLRTQPAARGFGPWGEANCVSHGNAIEWVIKLLPKDKNVRHLRSWDVEEARTSPAFTSLIPAKPALSAVLDKDSKLVIRGCSIGKDQELLDEIRELFGGETTVFAPKFLQYYEFRDGVAREGFYEYFFFYAKQKKTPGDDAAVAELQKKHSKAGLSEADWKRMLETKTRDPDGFRGLNASGEDRRETIPWRVGPLTIEHPGKSKKEATEHAKSLDWRGKAEEGFNAAPKKENLGTKFDDWFWEEGKLQIKPRGKNTTEFKKIFTGHRIRIEVRRELRDKKGKPVKPSLSNLAHYGRSPASAKP